MMKNPQPKSLTFILLIGVQGLISASSMVVEIVAGRMIAPYVGMSLYTWTSIIAIVLAGFSIGNWVGGKLATKEISRALKYSGIIMLAAAITTAGSSHLLRLFASPIIENISNPMMAIGLITLSAFFLPSLFAGIPAPILTIAAMKGRDKSEYALGIMYAIGAFGAIVGTLAAGFLLIPNMGSIATLIMISFLYLLSAVTCFFIAKIKSIEIAVSLISTFAVISLSVYVSKIPKICDRESEYFCIRTVELNANPPDQIRLMVIDHLAHGVSSKDNPRTMYTDHAALLDALARARMESTNFSSFHIGGGSYSIPRSWLDRGIEDITVSEIDPTVTAVAQSQFWFDPQNVKIKHQDARVILRNEAKKYDVIIGDAFTDIAVPEHLITLEFFDLVSDRLNEDGVFIMNFMDKVDRLDAFAALVTTLRQVFPQVEVWTEATKPNAGERRTFVLAASENSSPVNSIKTGSPDPIVFSVLSDKFIDTLITHKQPKLLTDNHAPLAYLMGLDPILQ